MANSFVAKFDAWGPPYWKVAHAVTFLYPEANPTREDKQHVLEFFRVFPHILPCGICGGHFLETIETAHPLNEQVLSSRATLTRWLVDLHNTVNRRLNKPEVPYEQVVKYYLQDCREPLRKCEQVCPVQERDGYMIALIVVVVVAVLVGMGVFAAVAKPKGKLTNPI